MPSVGSPNAPSYMRCSPRVKLSVLTSSNTTPSTVRLDSTAPDGAKACRTLAAVAPCSSKRLTITSAKSWFSPRGSVAEYTITSGRNAE